LGRRPFIIAMIMVVFSISSAYSDVFQLSSATGFQDEGMLAQDQLSLLNSLDSQWAPRITDPFSQNYTISYDYYATGKSRRFWDGIALNFDLSPVGWNNIGSATLRFYTQQGDYSDTRWHHYQVLQGAFNPLNEDLKPIWLTGVTDFGNHGHNGLVGWLDAPIPVSWITGDSFDVTLRLWNARIDHIELHTSANPEPGTILLLGTGLLGLGIVRRYRKRKAE
jgi:hypothetical protein